MSQFRCWLHLRNDQPHQRYCRLVASCHWCSTSADGAKEKNQRSLQYSQLVSCTQLSPTLDQDKELTPAVPAGPQHCDYITLTGKQTVKTKVTGSRLSASVDLWRSQW